MISGWDMLGVWWSESAQRPCVGSPNVDTSNTKLQLLGRWAAAPTSLCLVPTYVNVEKVAQPIGSLFLSAPLATELNSVDWHLRKSEQDAEKQEAKSASTGARLTQSTVGERNTIIHTRLRADKGTGILDWFNCLLSIGHVHGYCTHFSATIPKALGDTEDLGKANDAVRRRRRHSVNNTT
jgi:hypothetical protein